jgi:hypothetical protein
VGGGDEVGSGNRSGVGLWMRGTVMKVTGYFNLEWNAIDYMFDIVLTGYSPAHRWSRSGFRRRATARRDRAATTSLRGPAATSASTSAR